MHQLLPKGQGLPKEVRSAHSETHSLWAKIPKIDPVIKTEITSEEPSHFDFR